MGTFTTTDGVKLFYRLQGKQRDKQPTLLFIHGWCSNLEHWEQQAKYFSKTHRVLRLDRRGMGRSTTLGGSHGPGDHAADIAALVKSLGIRKVVAIGHAGGGPSTLELVRTYPRLVKAAVLVDSALYPLPSLDPPKGFGATLGPMLETLAAPKGKSAFKKMYQGYFSPKSDKSVARKAVADAVRTPLPIIIRELEGMIANTEAMARDIKQPVLWLTAANVDQRYIGKQFENIQFAEVVGAGHFPQLEVPAQTNAMIETFVGQL